MCTTVYLYINEQYKFNAFLEKECELKRLLGLKMKLSNSRARKETKFLFKVSVMQDLFRFSNLCWDSW